MIKDKKIPMAVEGLLFIIPLGIFSVLLFIFSGKTSGLISLFITIFLLFFFRDPKRAIPGGENTVLSPADGKVVVVKDTFENNYFHENVKQISIFLSIFNVHVNRIPISGIIESVKYIPGKFHVAALPKASLENEQTAIVIATDNTKIMVKQIAGILARRIICKIKPGDVVRKGDRYGLIYFGSRVDIFLPVNSEIRVKSGERVKGAKDVIAMLR